MRVLQVSRQLLLCLLCLLPLCAAAAAVASAMPLAAQAQAGSPLVMEVRTGVPAHLRVEHIAAMPGGAFEAFDAAKTYDTERNGVLWLRFRVLADEKSAATGWTLSLLTPYVDNVSLFHEFVPGIWHGQFAGRVIPNSRWAVPGMYPRFDLPNMAPGVHIFYVRLQTAVPRQFLFALQSADAEKAMSTRQLAKSGVVLSLLAFTVILSLALAAIYRNKIYAWYALFGLTSFFAVAGYVGISNYLFWPDASVWPKYLTLVPTMLTVCIQLHFSRLLFVSAPPQARIQRLVNTLLVFNLLCILAAVAAQIWPNTMFRLYAYSWVIVSSIALSLSIVLRAWRQGIAMAPIWILAYTPLFFSLSLSIAERFGIQPMGGLPIWMPLYVIAYELPVLLFILLWHSKTNMAHAVRQTTLASADPLTGFVPPSAFAKTAQTLWNEARDQKKDLGIAYVQVIRNAEQAALVNTDAADRERAQWVRIMRTVMREDDTVAQIETQVFAMFFKGQAASEDFSNRLSRLVTLGLMAPQDYAAPGAIQFRVVASTRGTATHLAEDPAATWAVLDSALRERLASDKGWSQSSIRLLGAVPVEEPMPDEVFSDAWAKALAVQMADEGHGSGQAISNENKPKVA